MKAKDANAIVISIIGLPVFFYWDFLDVRFFLLTVPATIFLGLVSCAFPVFEESQRRPPFPPSD